MCASYFREVEKRSTLVFKQDLPTVKYKKSKVKQRTGSLLPLYLTNSHRRAGVSSLGINLASNAKIMLKHSTPFTTSVNTVAFTIHINVILYHIMNSLDFFALF